MTIAGLDIGTTGCKCTVFDETGKELGKAYRDYPVSRAVSGHEIDVRALKKAVFEVIREMSGRHPDIGGIGITSFGETFVLTDQKGEPLHPSMLYTDPRGSEECRELIDHLGEMHIAEVTGLRPHEMYGISKMMWLKKHEPEIFGSASYIFQMEDYVVFLLSGKRMIDYSLATRTMAFDIHELDYSAEILACAGIRRDMLSDPVPSGTAAGTVTAEAAKKTGLQETCLVVAISQDQVAAAVGAGAFDGKTGVDGAGTVECLTPVYDEIPMIQPMYDGYFSVVPYVIPGKYVAYAFSYTGGALIQWCVDTLAKKEKEEAAALGISVNELLERRYREKRGEEPSGLLVLPHFAGAATPYMDTGSRGVIIGLTADTEVCEIYRACMEGVAYEMLVNYRAVRKSGVHFGRLNATGGGARSKVWMQMKADILNVPITALKTVDAGTVGSAMLTGIAAGVFRDLKDAAAHMVEETENYIPNPEMHLKYMKNFDRYEKVYSLNREIM
ncbi:MAG: carbohydrate kinase [Firmicutes bacterium]|nr:carbohydrate kinase [Bacillota bacterium]